MLSLQFTCLMAHMICASIIQYRYHLVSTILILVQWLFRVNRDAAPVLGHLFGGRES